MIRTRMHLRTPLLVLGTRALSLLLGLILVWYGAMLVLLAAKVSPHTVNSLSAYRSVYDFLAKLKSSDFSTHRRLAGGFGGVLAFLLLLYLALQELPRPYLARASTPSSTGDGGSLTIAPRVVERLAEIAASESRDVSAVYSRLGEGTVNVSIGVRRARGAAESLTDVRERVARELQRHDLAGLAVDVTLTKFEPTTGRNLS